MKYPIFIFIGLFWMLASRCASQQRLPIIDNSGNPIAFPGAEGFGKYSTGGRAGKVYVVTNLNDKDPAVYEKQLPKKNPASLCLQFREPFTWLRN